MGNFRWQHRAAELGLAPGTIRAARGVVPGKSGREQGQAIFGGMASKKLPRPEGVITPRHGSAIDGGTCPVLPPWVRNLWKTLQFGGTGKVCQPRRPDTKSGPAEMARLGWTIRLPLDPFQVVSLRRTNWVEAVLPGNPLAGTFMDFLVGVEVFAGPLDLLLYLVRRHEVEISEIPVAPITRPVSGLLGSAAGN